MKIKEVSMKKKQSMTKCPICATPTDQVLTNRLRRGEGTVLYCEACDHGFLKQDQKIDAKTYYDKTYRSEYSHHATGGATNAREMFDIYSKYQTGRLPIISPHLSKESKVLEIGASSGQFLANIQEQVAVVNAIELDKSCCDFMQTELGIDSDSEFMNDSKFADQKYDIVCSFQVLEHVESPVSFLHDLMTLLKEDGVAFIEVPNLRDPLLSVWDVKSYKAFYYRSVHLHYFTENSLKKVAMDAGFLSEQIEINFTQDYNILNHLNWITNDSPQATCDVGLSAIKMQGSNGLISGWLTERLKELNTEYIAKLVDAKATSNIMMVLKKAP
jgi:2-polyprenyl-3-methyl-5-hydroxy-6-metoxy-1,4-benzoquinol methylase